MQHEFNCIKVDRKTRMIPYYTCIEQTAPADPTSESNTLGLRRIAHRLYSIITATYKHLEAIMHSKQKLYIRTVHQLA